MSAARRLRRLQRLRSPKARPTAEAGPNPVEAWIEACRPAPGVIMGGDLIEVTYQGVIDPQANPRRPLIIRVQTDWTPISLDASIARNE